MQNINSQQEEEKKSSGEKSQVVKVKKSTMATPEQVTPERGDADLNARAEQTTSAFDLEATQSQNSRALQVVRKAHSESDYNNTVALTNMQDQFMEIMNNEQVEDVIDLNEKFLAMAFGVEVSELALLPKLELRVDTTCHSLQVTGEILPSLEYLKLNDSIVRCFRDIGTSFKNVRVLHIARCELTEVQGI